MAGRGGVHISYLVVALVICLGLIGYIVAQNQTITRLKGNPTPELTAKYEAKDYDKMKSLVDCYSRIESLEGTVRVLEEEKLLARDVLIGETEGKPNYASWKTRISDGAILLSETGEFNAQKYNSVQDLYDDLFKAIRLYRDRAASEESLRTVKEQEIIDAVAAKDQVAGDKETQISGLRAQLNELQVTMETAEAESKEEQDRLRSDLEKVTEEKDANIADLERQVWVERSLRNRADDRIAHLEREIKKAELFAEVDPDGQVIEASNELGYAWINLGKRDRLTRGVIFDVFQYVKGGKKLNKGSVEVLDVSADTAKVAILSVRDPLNPITRDDHIASPFYNKDETPIFVIAGEKLATQRLSRDELERRIKNYGGEIESKVRIETTYLVALTGYEASDEYETARKLGITILRENELLRFMEY